MTDRSLKRLMIAVAACLVAVVAAGSVLGSASVAADLADRSRTALAAADLADVHVDFRGREATLAGGNDVESRLATELVRAMPGVRGVETVRHDRPAVPGAAHFELDRAGDDVQIRGAVRSPDDAAALKVAVATVLRTTVTGDVRVDASVADAPWAAQVPAALEAAAGVEGLALEIRGDGTVTLGGQVADVVTRRIVARDVTRALPDLELVDVLRVVSPARKGS